jgi:hypothetical protein
MADVCLEVGKTYLNRHQEKVKIAFELQEDQEGFDLAHPFIGYNQNDQSWTGYTIQGYYYRWEESSQDLIREA